MITCAQQLKITIDSNSLKGDILMHKSFFNSYSFIFLPFLHIVILSSIFPCSFSALGIGRNQTEIDPETTLSTCGVHFCPADGSTEKDDTEKVNNGSNTVIDENFKTTDTQIYVLAGAYLACSLLAPILIAIFVEPLSRFVKNGT